MSLQLRNKVHESVVFIDRDSAPRIVTSGEDFLLEDLPIGTRVIYPKPPIKGLPNREAAIRYALNHPHDCEPLYAQLEPGMKVTIAVDDISLPLPPMATPDIRQTVLEVVLDLLAANGVDDVHIIIANSLHRKMTAWEMKRMVGAEIYDEFYPERYYNHDAEDPDGMVVLGETRHKEPLRMNRRCAESDLVIYCNINLVPMDGGHKSVAVGLCDYESLRAHHEPQTIRDSDSYMDPARSELSNKVARLGKLVDEHMNVFHIETAINNRMYKGEMDFLLKNEDEFSAFDRLKFEAVRRTLSAMPRAARRKLLHSVPAQYELIAPIYRQIEPFRDRRAGALSGGMKQKLALSCALVHRPEILFLDEPTTGVDAVSRREFWELLATLRSTGLTIVVSTPYMDEAARCDRVALIQQGRLLDVDAPAAIGARFPHPLLAVHGGDRYALLRTLRALPQAHSVHPFGAELHYADRRADADPLAVAAELRDRLRRDGVLDARVTPIAAGIEDAFMELMRAGGATG